MTIKIEIPATDVSAQRIIGEALIKIAEEKQSFIERFAQHQHHEVTQSPVTEVQEEVVQSPVVEVQEEEVIEPPVPQPPVPQPPVPQPSVPQPPVVEHPDFDVNGLPWDDRIHASTKTKNQDGTWKARRIPADMTPEEWETYQEEVVAELRGLISQGGDDGEEQFTFDELMVEITPQFKNPDFLPKAQEVLSNMGLSDLTDLRKAPNRIGEFRRGVGL